MEIRRPTESRHLGAIILPNGSTGWLLLLISLFN
uniref:Uncharacterized protein n=1 Tax=Rhizophora mucronata TaxID=61149 RepID=A0A2P2PP05_RHIMU